MGVIKNLATEKCVLLHHEHVFGRKAEQVYTVIKGPDISRSHATIRWTGHKWVVQDHSLNGTLCNQHLVHRASADLKKGDKITFGTIDGSKWEMVNDEAPISYLQSTSPPKEVLAMAARPGILTPDHDGVSFYLGHDGSWKAEMMGMVIDLVDGAKLKLGGKELQFIANRGFTSTINLLKQTSKARFVFHLSPDEERISIEIKDTDWSLNMGERVHNYLLLLLLRKRIADMKAEVNSPRFQGWMDMEDVTKDMGKEFRKEIDEYKVNLHIHRIRKQLTNLSPYGHLFSNVIDREKGKLKFAHPFYEIWKDGELLESNLAK